MKRLEYLKGMLAAGDRLLAAKAAVAEALQFARGGDLVRADAYMTVGRRALRETLAVLPRYGGESLLVRAYIEDALHGLARPGEELRRKAQAEMVRQAGREAVAKVWRDMALQGERERLVNDLAAGAVRRRLRGRG